MEERYFDNGSAITHCGASEIGLFTGCILLKIQSGDLSVNLLRPLIGYA